MDQRKQRIARNEASFRDINERLSRSLQQIPNNPDQLEFICECGRQDCEEHVHLTLAEYEQVRQDSRRFAIVPGHVLPEAEKVVSSGERFDVVQKVGEAVELTDESDSRTPGSAGRRSDSL